MYRLVAREERGRAREDESASFSNWTRHCSILFGHLLAASGMEGR